MEYIIDYENVGVNFDINIEIQGIENIIQDIEVYGYSIDDGEIVETSNEDIIFENSGGKAIFQEKISLLDGKTNQKIKLYLKWNDKEENNIIHTNLQGKMYKYKTSILFKQRI